MFPSSLNQLNLEERKAHAELMVIIASIDGELVQEELMMIESLMGSCMLHPEMRVDIRNMLNNPPEFDKTVDILSETGLKLALRDGALLSAVDGEYDKKELQNDTDATEDIIILIVVILIKKYIDEIVGKIVFLLVKHLLI